MEFLYDLLGRLHPLIVHLPIGFLVMGLMILVLDRSQDKYQKITCFIFFWATFSSLIAVLTGTVQYAREGYPWEEVGAHLILGVLTFVFSFLMYLKLRDFKPFTTFSKQFLGYSLLFVLLITGHLGGNLTHGKDHLTEPLPQGLKEAFGMEIPSRELLLDPESYRELSLYSGVIQPILNQKCVSCHNPQKTKGKLLLHNYKGIMDGGEEGLIISSAKTDESEILRRINLPRDEKKHMPPKAKIQLTKAEIKLIAQWVESGAPESTTISDLGVSQQLFNSFFPKDETGIYPNIELETLNKATVDSIKAEGLEIAPLYKTSNLLKISAINIPDFDDQNAHVLLLAKENIVDLDLGQTQVTDAVFEVLKELKNLTILRLDHTAIHGNGIESLRDHEHLKEINLVMTSVTESALQALFTFSALEKVYLFGAVENQESVEVPTEFRSIFDFGNYSLDPINDDSI